MELVNRFDSGRTYVTLPSTGEVLSDKAPPPAPARVSRHGKDIVVVIEGIGHNPLMKPPAPSPDIIYHYEITFKPLQNRIRVSGQHSWFPWHELLISDDERVWVFEQFDPLLESPARGLANPGLLFAGARVRVDNTQIVRLDGKHAQ